MSPQERAERLEEPPPARDDAADLLAAAEQAFDWLDGFQTENDTNSDIVGWVENLLERAIAKAKGETK